MAIVSHSSRLPGDPGQWRNGEPLWKVVPKRDEQGKAYSDFMMLAPALKSRTDQEMSVVLKVIHGVLSRFGEDVAFADFNVKLRVLWVSLRCRQGLMSQVVSALRTHVPELKLVGHHPNQGSSSW